MISKPKVLIIENSVHVTGALKSMGAMVRELSHRFEFIFILPKRSHAIPWVNANLPATSAEQVPVKIYEVPMVEISRSFVNLVSYVPALIINSIRVRKIIRDNNIDIVHCNDLYNLIPPFLKFFGARFSYVCHVRFLPDRFPPWLFRFWVKRQLSAAAKLFVVSEFLKAKLPADPKIVTVYDRIARDSNAFDPNNPATNVLLYLANVIPGKGHDVAIRAFRKLHHEFPDWKIRFVGGDMGLEKNKLYGTRLRTLGADVAQQIEWKGFTDDVETEYKNADIVLNFSESESFSMTCLEGQYFGRAVIATRSGGPAEIIEHGTTGLLVALADTDAIAEAMRQLMSDKSLRDRMGQHAAKVTRSKFGRETTTDALGKIYSAILPSKSSSQ